MGYWVMRTYTCGRVCEKTKYWVSSEKPTRSKRKIKSCIKKQEQNDASAEKEMARLLNLNFEEGDLLIGLDYSEKALKDIKSKITDDCDGIKTYQSASHELSLFMRRVKRELDKQGLGIKSIGITSDRDGESGDPVRVHHHLVVKGIMATGEAIDKTEQVKINQAVCEVIKRKWKNGGVNYKPLKAQDDYTPIAHYFVRQIRKIDNARKYSTTRNLIRPTYKDRIVISNSEIKVPARCKLLHRTEYTPYKPQYIRYLLPSEEHKLE